mmetsp:Transcript_4903/g.18418  ORF Transcript_4903/g.18418 Transcript_4903/m.18418 type:complete len:2238 (-) Transcript_4903:55-6768(-)|eukprot:CAMPEP_0117447526 /NCGR_PEP_ID=MMETSP0759-20121206/6923_1 /TAXON_ID=63605 /ORGANISM="Percolomonas cosmopolitus, Strain WS" /LENGTH=2237 /DNA_ID=CAMNT_0005239869 /DNA_START=188 /DNA_END=6901 /DNA_ORIENTATION=+
MSPSTSTSPPSNNIKPQYNSLEEYVADRQGKRVIRKILIANNGIAAVKGIRSIRQWLQTHFLKRDLVRFVVMATPDDIDANAEYVRLADEIHEVKGGSNANNFANVELITEIARLRNCDAVFPGWGHASEYPELPRSLSKHGITFIGPAADAMYILGDKISSSIIAETAEVPSLPWSGSGLKCRELPPTKEGETPDVSGLVPEDLFREACVTTAEEALEKSKKIGFPLMVKASEGGGGKGIRMVTNEEELKQGFRQVSDEVLGSPIFLMKLGSDCRHVEVQLVADEYNNALALYSRDCSVQRRHQKIIEEGPVTVAPQSVLREMEAAAVRLSRQVHYRGAGTVEYLYLPATQTFCFLELNPRLQVEHPVTERITDVSIPSVQFNIAMGVPLQMIPDIRRWYQKDLYGNSEIVFGKDKPRDPIGHCIACRVTAENPEEGFRPTGGSIDSITFVSTPNVWGYFALRNQGGIHSFSDSQFGHIFAHGLTRNDARKNMLHALYELSIRGEIRTTSEYLISLLEHETFADNTFTTSWLDKCIKEKSITLPKPDNLLVVKCGALHTIKDKFSKAQEEWKQCIQKGQHPADDLLKVTYSIDLIYQDTKYSINATIAGPNSYVLILNDSSTELSFKELTDGALLVMMNDGSSHVTYAQKEPTGLRVTVDGKVCLFSEESDPSELRANASGKLVRYLVEDGSFVKAGAPYVELEVMKMIMTLCTPLSGKIRLNCIEGGTVNIGEILARLDLEDKSQIKKSGKFVGQFDSQNTVALNNPHKMVARALAMAENILSGYTYPSQILPDKIKDIADGLETLREPQVVLIGEFREVLSTIRNAVPKKLYEELHSSVLSKNSSEWTAESLTQLKQIHTDFASKIASDADRASFLVKSQPLTEVLAKAANGLASYTCECLTPLLEHYYQVEHIFDQGKRQEEITLELREQNKETPLETFNIWSSHYRLKEKNKLIRGVLQLIEDLKVVEQAKPILDLLGNMRDRHYSDVVLMVKQILLRFILPSHQIMHNQMEALLHKALEKKTPEANALTVEQREILQPVIEKSNYNFDILLGFFFNEHPELKKMAIEVYIRKAYQTFEVTMQELSSSVEEKYSHAIFNFINKEENSSVFVNKDVILGSASTDSLSSLSRLQEQSDGPVGFGVLLLFKNYEDFQHSFADALKVFSKSQTDLTNVLHVYIGWDDKKPQDEVLVEQFSGILQEHADALGEDQHDIKRVTIMVNVPNKLPFYYTFRQRLDYGEDPTYRHIEPTLAFQLYLRKLSNYDIEPFPVQTPSTHIYYATKKQHSKRLGRKPEPPSRYDYLNTRFFVRTLVLRGDALLASQEDKHKQSIYISESHRYLNDALKHLELAMADTQNYKPTYGNHIFVNVLPPVVVNAELVNDMMKEFQTMYAKRLMRLRISEVELKVNVKTRPDDTETVPLHIFATNKTGYHLVIEIYQEKRQAGNLVYSSMNKLFGYEGDATLDNVPISSPYPLLKPNNMKRRMAHNYNTSYVHDFPFIFQRQLKQIWKQLIANTPKEQASKVKVPSRLFSCTEYILDKSVNPPRLIECLDSDTAERYRNGMIAWKMTLHTPEYPEGREIIVIANDITFMSGSFGPDEDEVFNLASIISRQLKIPRIYITANSGARIGIANEIKGCFKIAWNQPENPQKGYKYLYLNEEDYVKYKKSVKVEAIPADECPRGEVRYRIVDIIGKDHGIGVENLRGSGKIAGETSRSYKDVFTLSYVASRTVGIGAYLVRLGQRVIQNKNPPILLTGAGALNKVLNKKVYSSNLQLGGIQIMHPNGVTHSVVKDDGRGIGTILTWLSYVPKHRDAPLPTLPVTLDHWDRDVTYTWTKETTFDPRLMIQGGLVGEGEDERFLSGMFDRESFFETLDGWAKNIVVGRARLGGIPMGVIAVDTATIQQVIPADPADDASQERVIAKSGQVWFPDSAYKTAQAIQDFNNGEQLPLMIFANWRGFSGGQRDMFDEILKYGSFIVDALVEYKQPVFVYLPPHAELRGGAWVVVDPTINEDVMEMYADEYSKGGVLEPNGTVEIKYRTPDVENTIRRLDYKYIQLAHELSNSDLTMEQKSDIEEQMKKRVKDLVPIYNHIAIQFCDLHDTPGRMKEKGVISDVMQWKNSRRFFFWRLRRRLAEFNLYRVAQEIDPSIAFADKKRHVEELIPKDIVSNNRAVAQFLEQEETQTKFAQTFTTEYQKAQFEKLKKQTDSAALLGNLLSVLSDEEKNQLKTMLQA